MENCIGRILTFTTQFPKVGYGALKKRNDIKLMNTE